MFVKIIFYDYYCFIQKIHFVFKKKKTIEINPMHPLMIVGGVNGVIEAWDARDRRCCASLTLSDTLTKDL